MAFAAFMNSTFGRILRVVAGAAMIAAGLAAVGGPPGIVLAVAGTVPLAAGVFDFCLLAPILSVPWSGAKIRSMTK
jgi:hypothetical protein